MKFKIDKSRHLFIEKDDEYLQIGIGKTIEQTNLYKYKRIVLLGKMASGKDYLKSYLKDNNIKHDISFTTRPIREGEVDSIDYYYISEKDFLNMIDANKFYEYDKFVDWYYGTTNESWNTNQLFIMTPIGISKIKQKDRKDCFILYLDIDESVRIDRLKDRDMEYDSIGRRIKTDNLDFEESKLDFDIRIKNCEVQ